MKKIKNPSAVNSFYSGNPAELSAQIRSFGYNNYNNSEYKSRAVIVPHAGLVFSGKLSFEGINQLDKNLKTLFIFAPAHKVWYEGIALTSYDEWDTPLGKVQINKEITQELADKYGAKYNDDAFIEEHSVEVQLPIIQSVIGNVKIVPVLIANESSELITRIISDYWSNKDFGFIISSDLSHYMTDEKAKKLDNITAQMIENKNFNGVVSEQACGIIGIIGLSNFAKQNNYSLIRLNMINSSAISGDISRVVGYGTWFLYEGDKNDFIKDYYGKYLLELVKKVIKLKFKKQEQLQIKYPQVLDEIGACFITLEKFGKLRGCIGSVGAFRPLIYDIVNHSTDAAFKDPRFIPVTENEVDDLSVAISLLSTPSEIEFNDEIDLLEKIVPNIDGLIIQDGDKQAVYLPSVWEQIPDKKEFLNSLKLKAGMSVNHFSKTFKAYRFITSYIK